MKDAVDSDKINTYHFNMLRSILEKTSTFFGYDDFSKCIHGVEDEVLYSRALNLLSHGKYSIYEPVEMGDDNKILFIKILRAFLDKYKFDYKDGKCKVINGWFETDDYYPNFIKMVENLENKCIEKYCK